MLLFLKRGSSLDEPSEQQQDMPKEINNQPKSGNNKGKHVEVTHHCPLRRSTRLKGAPAGLTDFIVQLNKFAITDVENRNKYRKQLITCIGKTIWKYFEKSSTSKGF